MTITETRPGHWDVLSERSGKTYQITDIGDVDIGRVLECTCPAFVWGHGRECRHIKAWLEWRNRQAGHPSDATGCDVDELPF